MKISKRQKEEIDFLVKVYRANPSQEEMEDYISVTVHGGKTKFPQSSLLQAKWNLDIDIKQWREDLTLGLLGKNELKTDFNCPYADRLVESIISGITKEYRRKILEKNDNKITVLAITNFLPQC